MMLFKKTRKSQEEMIGFALIVIIVFIILLIFLGLSLRKGEREAVESYEVENFIQALLEYNTDCSDNAEYLSIKELIFSCNNGEKCVDERDTCEVLDGTLGDILREVWRIGEEYPVKGYKLDVLSDEIGVLLIEEGEETGNSKGSIQSFARRSEDYDITFTIYY